MATVYGSPSSIEWIKRFVIAHPAGSVKPKIYTLTIRGLIWEYFPGGRGSAELTSTVHQPGSNSLHRYRWHVNHMLVVRYKERLRNPMIIIHEVERRICSPLFSGTSLVVPWNWGKSHAGTVQIRRLRKTDENIK
jgi:hypothetical protein